MLLCESRAQSEVAQGAGASGTKPMSIDCCNLMRVFAESFFDIDALAQPTHNLGDNAVDGFLSMA